MAEKLWNKLNKYLEYRKYGIKVGKGTKIYGATHIGANSYIGKNCVISSAQIGNYCSIADGVKIGPGEHDIHKVSTSSYFYDDPMSILLKKDCIIEDDAWIGVDAIILRGANIGFGAIIGANSVVTKSVPPFAVAVGAPAKVIKFRFSSDIQQIILESKWWTYNRKGAKLIIDKLEDQVSIFKTMNNK